jgi:hypothetical protein
LQFRGVFSGHEILPLGDPNGISISSQYFFRHKLQLNFHECITCKGVNRKHYYRKQLYFYFGKGGPKGCFDLGGGGGGRLPNVPGNFGDEPINVAPSI